MKFKWIDVFLIVFGLFLAYQIVRNILGGSWETESLIIGMLFVNMGLLWKLSLKFEGHISWHKFKDEISA